MTSFKRSYKYFIFLSFIFFSHTLHCLPVEEFQKINDFFILTIPKSGTHLLIKFLYMVNIKTKLMPRAFRQLAWSDFPGDHEGAVVLPEEFEARMSLFKERQFVAIAHTNFSKVYKEFIARHPEYILILQIRDLRDILVSEVYFQWDRFEELLGPSTFDQKLTYLLRLHLEKTKTGILPIYRYAEEACSWMNNENVLICRFEDLVGEMGGGSCIQQENQILSLISMLGLTLSEEKLKTITSSLFGVEEAPRKITWTFRKGEIGTWKDHFKPSHIKEFNKEWGHLQVGLGYSLE